MELNKFKVINRDSRMMLTDTSIDIFLMCLLLTLDTFSLLL